jgi:cyanophycin synthetase
MECERINKIPRKVVYFSLNENNPLIRSHLQSGGTAYFARGSGLVESSGNVQRTMANASMLPVMMNGTADFQLTNLLATVAACRAFGVEHDVLLKALISFSSADNPGRANLYRLNGGHVMVDYGHNSDAFEAICRMTSNWKDRRVTGIITVPGDRDDSIIDRAARVAAKGFDKVVVREDHDLRGRKRGEVANILCRGVRETSPTTECEVVLDEVEALRQAVSRMAKGEVIVVFYEKLQPVQQALEEMAAQPVVSLPPMPIGPTPHGERSTLRRISSARAALAKSRRISRRWVPALPPA